MCFWLCISFWYLQRFSVALVFRVCLFFISLFAGVSCLCMHFGPLFSVCTCRSQFKLGEPVTAPMLISSNVSHNVNKIIGGGSNPVWLCARNRRKLWNNNLTIMNLFSRRHCSAFLFIVVFAVIFFALQKYNFIELIKVRNVSVILELFMNLNQKHVYYQVG